MNNLLSKSWFRFISLVLIHAFLMLDVAWAGGTELNLQKNADTLAAPVEISQQMFMESVSKLYKMNTLNLSEPQINKAQLPEDEDIVFGEANNSRLTKSRYEVQNIISFLSPQDELPKKAKALVVFGNEDLQTPIQAAHVYLEKQPEVVVFAGGIGQGTQNLWELGSEYLSVEQQKLTELSEAEVFSMIFKEELKKQGLTLEEIDKINILLEKTSRNSQENAKNSLKLLYSQGFLDSHINIILMQKPLLQRRSGANLERESTTLEKELNTEFSIKYFNYAPYVPNVSAMNNKKLEKFTNDALGEVERLKMYPTPRFNFIDSITIPRSVDKAYYNLSKLLYPDQFIESEGELVAGLIREKDNARSDINRPVQVESGEYRAGSSFAGFATERYQGSLYLLEGVAEARIKDDKGIVQTIELGKGDIINLFVTADIVFREDSNFYIFRQTDASKTTVDRQEKLEGETNIDKGVVVKKDENIVADIYRDRQDDLIATVHRAGMDSPAGMVMTTPKSAAIGIGVKTANGNEAAHRHELDGKSKMEIALCLSGSLTANVGNKDGKDANKVDVGENELLIIYPDSVHGFEFNNAKMAIVIQDPGRGMDKVEEVSLANGAKIRRNGIHYSDSFSAFIDEARQIKGLEISLDGSLSKNLPVIRSGSLRFMLNKIILNSGYEELQLKLALFNMQTYKISINMGLFDQLKIINDNILHFLNVHQGKIPKVRKKYRTLAHEMTALAKYSTEIFIPLRVELARVVLDYNDARVQMYAEALILDLQNNWFDRQFAGYVKDKRNNQYVWSQEKLINELVKPNLYSSLADNRERAHDLFYRFYLAGMITAEQLIEEFTPNLKSKLPDLRRRARIVLYQCFLEEQITSEALIEKYISIIKEKENKFIYKDLDITLESALALTQLIDERNAQEYQHIIGALEKISEALGNILTGMRLKNIGDYELSVEGPHNQNGKCKEGKKKILTVEKQMLEILYLIQIIKKSNGLELLKKNGLIDLFSQKAMNGIFPIIKNLLNNNDKQRIQIQFVERAI